jgi:hypothetical protein
MKGDGYLDHYGFHFNMSHGFRLSAPFDKRTNLPMLPLSLASGNPMEFQPSAFWSQAFGFDDVDQSEWSVFLNVTDDENTSLSTAQKELLLWHQRLSHINIQDVRRLVQPPGIAHSHADPARELRLPQILPVRNPGAASTAALCKCGACLMAKARRRSSKTSTEIRNPNSDRILRRDHISPGDCLSTDHYSSPIRGRRLNTYGRRTDRDGYVGGAMYVDHASSKLFSILQQNFDAAETISGKQFIEDEAKSLGFKIKSYHSDNGIFTSEEFQQHCRLQNQTISFCGVGAKHQRTVWRNVPLVRLATLLVLISSIPHVEVARPVQYEFVEFCSQLCRLDLQSHSKKRSWWSVSRRNLVRFSLQSR